MSSEKRRQLFLECRPTMMLRLILNISSDVTHFGKAHGEGRVANLPFKIARIWECLVNPASRIRLDFSDSLCHGKIILQFDYKVYVVGNAAGPVQTTAEIFYDPMFACVELFAPGFSNERLAHFGAVNDMVEEFAERVSHRRIITGA